MKVVTGTAVQDVINIVLTPHEAYMLWCALDSNKNTVARAVNAELLAYAKSRGVTK